MTGHPRDLKGLTEMLKQASREAEVLEKSDTAPKSKQSSSKRKRSTSSDLADIAIHTVSRSVKDVPADMLDWVSPAPPVMPSIEASGGGEPPSAPPPIEVLKEAIRSAIRLEFATVPPYLIALWSIIDQSHPVAKSIRAVAHEEMLHVSILCNFLSALGDRPVLTGDMVPKYPGKLPGGVHPELEVQLLGYSDEALRTFLEIERPEEAVEIVGEPQDSFPSEDTTIGNFYAAVLEVFEKLRPELDPSHQIAGPFSWFVLTKPDDVREAIGLITSQGEGARGVPYNRYPKYLSHYYRFKAMSLSVELVWDDKVKKLKKGKPLPKPSVFTLAPASPKGYDLAVPRQLREANEKFVSSFSRMLRLLEESWKDGGHKSFVSALEHMFDLTERAQTMMRIPTPDGRGYCPAFIYRA